MEVEVEYTWRRCSRCGEQVVGRDNGIHVVSSKRTLVYVHRECVKVDDVELGTIKKEDVITIIDKKIDGEAVVREIRMR